MTLIALATHQAAARQVELYGGGVLLSDGPHHEAVPHQELLLHLVCVLVPGELQPHRSGEKPDEGGRGRRRRVEEEEGGWRIEHIHIPALKTLYLKIQWNPS